MFFGLADGMTQDKDFGCASFLAKSPDGEYLAGRNYDYSDSDALIFYTNPANGYASIGMTEQRALGIGEPFGIAPDSLIGKAAMLTVPYITMDGVNEKGVMVSILQLTLGGIHQDTGKPSIDIWVAIRLILDRADSTDRAVVVEWKGNEMRVVRDQAAVTNFQLGHTNDKSLYSGKCPRFDTISEWLTNHSATTPEQAMDVLQSTSQSGGSYPTQWLAVYHLRQFSVDVTIDRHYDKVYHFTAEDF